MAVLSSKIDGFAKCLRWLQKYLQTVLLAENLKLFLETQSCTLFTHSCVSLCACGMSFARIQRAQSPTNNGASEPFKTDLTILLILRLEKAKDPHPSAPFRAQELCESRGGRPGLPVPNILNNYGLCGRKATLNSNIRTGVMRDLFQSSGAVWKPRWPSWAPRP